ncbi:hypothetical protein CCACVL1_10030 [Corchorus capsularis]|uniref:Uncharacterized protein n=1 Tax=Corchorus capsularis TaxID=210143 RepID=A0A1R3IT38_COCAP|nr:hypothetical protein CCACVL1_10030 [Corchorus capsularis]
MGVVSIAFVLGRNSKDEIL